MACPHVPNPKRINLSMEKLLKLNDWFGTNQEWLLDRQPSYPEAAAKAAADLGYEVTPSNIKACNEARGTTYKPRLVTSKAANRERIVHEVSKQLSPLAAHVEELAIRVRELEDAVVRLCKGLGERPPKGTGAENLRVVNAVPPANASKPGREF